MEKLNNQLLRAPAEALPEKIDEHLGSSRVLRSLVHTLVMQDPCIAGKLHAYQPERQSYILRRAPETDVEIGPPGLPMPPEEFRWGLDAELFLDSGRIFVERMRKIIEESGASLEKARRILDFGCGPARLIRWLSDLAQDREIWGVDLQADYMHWCQQYLNPPFRFVTTTSIPYLPFPDDYFDLIYATSVFTHIDDLAEAWLLELKRITSPGGRLYITIHDNHTLALLMDPEYCKKIKHEGVSEWLQALDRELHFTDGFQAFVSGREPGTGYTGAQVQVYYDLSYVRKHWGRFLDVLSTTEEALGYQTAILLRK